MNTQNTTPTRKILVVDDDPRLRDLLRRYLSEQGFNVFVAEDAKEMGKLWQREHFDLLVLDLMLPGEDGLSICRRLRGGHDNTPIIMLTAKAEEIDRIVGLEMGADDYLSKPFNPRELLARINAILRRRGTEEHPGAPSQENESIAFGPYTLNLSTRTLTRNGEQVPTPPEDPAVARQAHGTGARPRIRSLRSQPGRADLAPAQADRTESVQARIHPDRLGSRIRVCAGRW
jgi:two-component system phosphate regulon response regulator OmpR